MLGLGDIAVPGLFCALLAKWDAVPTLAELQGSFWCVLPVLQCGSMPGENG